MLDIHSGVMAEEEATEIERNWTDLPLELFPFIFKKLPDICDFIRARAVCKPWRFSTSVSDQPPQFPWILKHSEGPGLEFYSVAFDKVYTIHAPAFSDMKLLQPVGSYMLVCQNGNTDCLSLLNPLNNCEIPLPVLEDPWLLSSSSWIRPPSFQSDGHMLFINNSKRVAVCRPGDNKWDVIVGSGPEYGCRYFYMNDLVFMVDDSTGVTKVMDVTSCKELYVIPPPKDEKSSIDKDKAGPYLVESGGDILRVCRYNITMSPKYEFVIHRLERGTGDGHHCWVKVRSIGDRILFFNIDITHGFSLSVNDFAALKGNSSYFATVRHRIRLGNCRFGYEIAGFKENCIYFIEIAVQYRRRCTNALVSCHHIKMYDIESGKTYESYGPFNNQGTIDWFMPTLNSI